MARTTHTILGGLALGAGLLVAAAAPAAALSPIPDDQGGGFAPNDPLVSIGDAHAYEADGAIEFPITLSKPSDQITFITVQRFDDSTTHADFSGFPTPMAIFTPGVTTSTVSFPIIDDDGVEDPETMTAEIVGTTGDVVVNDGEATGTLYDGDGPVLGATMDDVAEGDPGDDVSLTVEATLSYAPPEDITFTLATQVVGFGAVPGEDFTPVDDTFTIPAGATSTTVSIPVTPDDHVDDDDGVVMAIASDPSRGSVWNNTAVGKILDDDSEGEGSEGEGSGGDGEEGSATDDPAPSTTEPTTSTTDDTDSTEVAMAAAGGTKSGGDSSGPPLLPVAGLLGAGFAGAWWFLGRRERDDDVSPSDPTGLIQLD